MEPGALCREITAGVAPDVPRDPGRGETGESRRGSARTDRIVDPEGDVPHESDLGEIVRRESVD